MSDISVAGCQRRYIYIKHNQYPLQHSFEPCARVVSLLRIDQQHNQITPEDRLTVLCEITIDGKDVQQSGKAQVQGCSAVRQSSGTRMFSRQAKLRYKDVRQSGKAQVQSIKQI